jgi:hypothetical protein
VIPRIQETNNTYPKQKTKKKTAEKRNTDNKKSCGITNKRILSESRVSSHARRTKKCLNIKTKREVHVITVQTFAHRVKNLNKNHVRHQPTAPPPTKTTPRPYPTPPLHPTEKKSKEKKKVRTRTEKEKRRLAKICKSNQG